MQKLLTVKGKKYSAKKIVSMIINDDIPVTYMHYKYPRSGQVTLNGVTFNTQYKKTDDTQFDYNRFKYEADIVLLWDGSYKYAIVLPLEAKAT